MGIVRFALRFPHTFYVLAAFIVFLGVIAIRTMPTDIFPEINIPVVTVIWHYTGLSTPEMEQRVTTYSEYSISSNVNGIKNMEVADARWSVGPEDLLPARRQSRPRHLPDRLGDELDPRADAARHPAADHRAVQRLERAGAAAQPQLRQPQRAAALRLRHLPSAPAAGAGATASPSRRPAGGKYRQIMVDLDPDKLLAQGLDADRRRQRGQRAEPHAALGNGQDRRHAIRCRTNATPPTHRRPEQHPDQGRQRRDRLHQGRRPGSRRLGRAAERRARGRPALGAAQRHQERQRLDARRGQRRRRGTGRRPRSRAARAEDQRTLRPVGVRQRIASPVSCARAPSRPA